MGIRRKAVRSSVLLMLVTAVLFYGLAFLSSFVGAPIVAGPLIAFLILIVWSAYDRARFRCAACGKSAFEFGKYGVVSPWPRKRCSGCGADLRDGMMENTPEAKRAVMARQLFDRGREMGGQADYAAVIEDYSAALELGLSPDDRLWALYGRGYAYELRGDRARAAADYRMFLSLKANDAVAKRLAGLEMADAG